MQEWAGIHADGPSEGGAYKGTERKAKGRFLVALLLGMTTKDGKTKSRFLSAETSGAQKVRVAWPATAGKLLPSQKDSGQAE
ncbi:MAG: hypothetical protein ACRD4H_02970 [Candidatus Acidiferrales bacterium]